MKYTKVFLSPTSKINPFVVKVLPQGIHQSFTPRKIHQMFTSKEFIKCLHPIFIFNFDIAHSQTTTFLAPSSNKK